MKRAHPYSYYTTPGGVYGDHDDGEELARKRRLVSSFEGLSLSNSRGRKQQQQQQQQQQLRTQVPISPALASTPPTSPPTTTGDSDADLDIETDTDDDGIVLSSHVPNLVLDRLLASMTARRYADPSKPGADPTRGTAGNRYAHFYERWWTTALIPRATVFAGAPDPQSLVWARFTAFLARLQKNKQQQHQQGADYDYIGDCDVDMDLDDDQNGEAAAGYAYALPTVPPRYPSDDDDYDDDDDDSMEIDWR